MESGHSTPIRMGAAVLAAVVYLAGYFALCSAVVPQTDDGRYEETRVYPSSWIADAFRPVALLEELLTGKPVQTRTAADMRIE